MIMENWVVWGKANRKLWSCILSRPSGLESLYTNTRPKATEKSKRRGQFAVFTKNLDFSRLWNEIRTSWRVHNVASRYANVVKTPTQYRRKLIMFINYNFLLCSYKCSKTHSLSFSIVLDCIQIWQRRKRHKLVGQNGLHHYASS